MSASNNTGRGNSYRATRIEARSRSPTSGWYTFQHHFKNNGSGVLAAELTVSTLGSATPLAHVDAERPRRRHRHTVGGNRYGWLANNELPLALDNITRSGIVVAPTPTCKTVTTSLGSFTAAVVNPGTDYAGPLPLSGCQIGVYFDQAGSVTNADIAGATHYGVFADKGAKVDVTDSKIHQIGNSPFNGAQNGRAVFYANGATGTVSGNTIYDYQKNGVHATGRQHDREGAEQHGHRPRARSTRSRRTASSIHRRSDCADQRQHDLRATGTRRRATSPAACSSTTRRRQRHEDRDVRHQEGRTRIIRQRDGHLQLRQGPQHQRLIVPQDN